MRPARLLVPALLYIFSPALTISPAFAQKAAPVENVSSFAPRSPLDERKALHVPPGFEVQLVAAEPEIHKPLNIAFDDRGRLWLTESVEYPFPAPEGKPARDAVKVLEDFGPDGRARKVTTFADGLNIPIGVLPLPDGRSALVHAIPNVYLMTDTDGDGRADRRVPAYQSYGFRDTHGMTNAFTWGFDGWVYACHGFSNESTIRGSDRRPITMQSGNTYRMRPDGSHAEYFTHGQVNPFGLAFDPLGNLYSCDCHSRPIYQLLPGAYYPSFGKPDDGLGFGPEMMSHDHGSTAIAGIVSYDADQFPAEYHGRIFIGNVVTNRVNHDRLEWRGSSPRAVEQPDFVWSEDNWFRPVDLELGPDGALYVADFYNRIIGHYEVPLTHPGRDRERGRIWRIVYRGPDGKGQARPPRADWTKATTGELIGDLGHPNLAVRTKAANQLAARPPHEPLLASVAKEENPLRKVHALWVLHRWGILDEATLKNASADPRREVRVHVMRVLSETSPLSGPLHELALAGLRDSDPFVKRAAADALGRHPDRANIRPLLDLRRSASSNDTHLVHVVRMALRDQLRPDSAWSFLEDLTLSERDARDVADVAVGVPTAEAARYLLRHVEHFAEPHGVQVRYIHHVARYGAGGSERALEAFIRSHQGDGPDALVDLLRAIQQGTQERGGKLGAWPQELALELAGPLLDSKKKEEVAKGINLASTFRIAEARGRLSALAEDPRAAEPLRADALSALVAMDPNAALGLLTRLLDDTSQPVGYRERVAVILGTVNRPEARDELLKVLATASGRLQTMIAAVLAARRPGAEALLDAIAAGKASARLLQESRVANPLAASKIPGVKERVAGLLRGLPPADVALNDLLRRRRTGFASSRHDPVLGAKVFEKTCAACHQIGGKGARIGPQLDGVGARGADRLLEDVLDPSRNVDQTFRVTNLALKDGRTVSGLLLREEGAVLVLADPQGKEVRVDKDSVEERGTAQLSPMPANLVEQLSESELYHLVDYLLTQKVGRDEKAPAAGGR
jgi:putative heme-binding domain-containing protein